MTRISEHVNDDPRFVPRPLANLLRVPSAPEYALVVIERRSSPSAPWVEILRADPRALGGAWADEGLSNGAVFSYRMYGIDAAGHKSALSRVVDATVKQDPTAPIGALRIDTPAPRTDSSAVATNLELYFDGELGMQMKLWWADEVPPRSWSPFSPTALVPVTAVATPTSRTLMAQLRDAAGNESLRYSDSIEVYPPNGLGDFTGTVAPRAGGFPGGVRVAVGDVDGDSSGEAPIFTDADGHFEIPDLAPGTYRLRFYDSLGNTTVSDDLEIVAGATTDLGTVPIPEPDALALALVAAASIALLRRRRGI